MLQLRILPHDDFVHAHLGGLVSVASWAQGLRDLEQAVSGALMAAHLARMELVAAHIQAEKIAGVVQAQARRNGLNLRLFPSYDEAVRWVMA